MCGIAGAFGLKAVQQVCSAADALRHRGPEGAGFYQDPQVPFALAHSRLSIIDLSEATAQPLRYMNRYVIVHNGELYNYIEIKGQLQQNNYPFHTDSDTEVIVAAYACWGSECLHRFDGAFAFAIWDELEKTLFAARDRMGEKPLFFSINGNQFLFASEMKALWAAGIAKAASKSMLYNYLTLGYTINPYDKGATFFEGIQQLPPATSLQYKAGDANLLLKQYWKVDIEEKSTEDGTAIETFRHLLSASVQRRLRSDVPIGTSLSGGLDSSTIVALCAAMAAPNYSHQCFTASFPGYAKDETAKAAAVAAQFHLQHHVVPVGVADVLGNMEAVSRQQEAPVQSASVLAQWQVYGAAKAAGVTVLLDGQGADELLAGYHRYYLWYWRELYAQKKLKSSGELKAASSHGVSGAFGLKQKAAALFPHFAASLWQKQKDFSASVQTGLHPHLIAAGKDAFAYAQPLLLSLNGVLHYNSFTYGLEELLRYADRNSMAHAVEVRLPFLSHELAEFLFTLPASFKIRNGWTKWLLRETVKNILPPDITWRTDKVGFEPPQRQWMQDAQVQRQIRLAKEILVSENVLLPSQLKQRVQAKDAHAASNMDWRYWSASYLFR